MTGRIRAHTVTRTLAAAALACGVIAVGSCMSERSTAVVSSDGNCVAPASTAGATVVFVRQFAYLPAQVHVRAGGSVAWVNCESDGTPHTATADDASFDSGVVAPNDAYIRAFPTAGTTPYHCDLHPFMKASVIVD
jgi:plastocyanin